MINREGKVCAVMGISLVEPCSIQMVFSDLYNLAVFIF